MCILGTGPLIAFSRTAHPNNFILDTVTQGPEKYSCRRLTSYCERFSRKLKHRHFIWFTFLNRLAQKHRGWERCRVQTERRERSWDYRKTIAMYSVNTVPCLEINHNYKQMAVAFNNIPNCSSSKHDLLFGRYYLQWFMFLSVAHWMLIEVPACLLIYLVKFSSQGSGREDWSQEELQDSCIM